MLLGTKTVTFLRFQFSLLLIPRLQLPDEKYRLDLTVTSL